MRQSAKFLLVAIAAGALYGASQSDRIAAWLHQGETPSAAAPTPLPTASLLGFPSSGAAEAAPATAASASAGPRGPTSGSGMASGEKTDSASLEEVFARLGQTEPVYAAQLKDYLGVGRTTVSLEDLQTKATLLMERRRRLYENPEASSRVIEGFLQATRDLPSLAAERGMAMSVLVSMPAGDRPGLRGEITDDVRGHIAAQTQDPSYFPQVIRAYLRNSGAASADAKEAFLSAIGPVADPAVKAEIDAVFEQAAAR